MERASQQRFLVAGQQAASFPRPSGPRPRGMACRPRSAPASLAGLTGPLDEPGRTSADLAARHRIAHLWWIVVMEWRAARPVFADARLHCDFGWDRSASDLATASQELSALVQQRDFRFSFESIVRSTFSFAFRRIVSSAPPWCGTNTSTPAVLNPGQPRIERGRTADLARNWRIFPEVSHRATNGVIAKVTLNGPMRRHHGRSMLFDPRCSSLILTPSPDLVDLAILR